ncbi:MAG: cation:proton antiporter, partial [Leptospiraceae bacterium]|nr:cation:proton antiporter [Leptospiraceae bacterium]
FTYTDGKPFLRVLDSSIKRVSVLGNQELIHKNTILKMYDGLAWLMQIVLFLTLGLLVFPSQILPFIGIGLLISIFLIVVARPVSVLLSLFMFKMEIKRRLYISWVGLRGAVPIVFATYPLLAGIDKAYTIFNIVFFISVTSVLIQGTTISIIAKWLHVSLPEKIKNSTETDRLILDLPKSTLQEFEILSDFCAVGKKIVDLDFPKSVFIIMIKRGGEYIRPGGSTIIEAKDILMVLADAPEDFEKVDGCIQSQIKKM